MKRNDLTDRAPSAQPWVRRIVDESGQAQDQPTGYRASGLTTVETLMSRTTYCVRPEVAVDSVITMLLEHHMSGVPVVDEDGRPIGVITKTDLLRHLHERGDGVDTFGVKEGAVEPGFHPTDFDGATAGDVMMPVVFAVEQDVTVAQAAALMAGEGIHRVPVIDAGGTVVGILSTLDITRWVATEAGYKV